MTTITLGRRLVPLEQIALVEPFDPSANPRMQTDRPFKARVVLINRDSILTEEKPSPKRRASAPCRKTAFLPIPGFILASRCFIPRRVSSRKNRIRVGWSGAIWTETRRASSF